MAFMVTLFFATLINLGSFVFVNASNKLLSKLHFVAITLFTSCPFLTCFLRLLKLMKIGRWLLLTKLAWHWICSTFWLLLQNGCPTLLGFCYFPTFPTSNRLENPLWFQPTIRAFTLFSFFSFPFQNEFFWATPLQCHLVHSAHLSYLSLNWSFS
jgi:hypothetical protein